MHQYRPWSDLPTDILSSVADRLGIIELLCFRGTCKDFRYASSTASAEIESSRTPWLLFQETQSSNCIIYNPHDSKIYNKNIPEHKDVKFLASYQGWLLLLKQQSIFFFNPFSGAKIVLPKLPLKEDFFCGAGVLSDIPTSPHCTVSVISFTDEIFVISKGESEWTCHKIPENVPIRIAFVLATSDYKSQNFYFMRYWNSVVMFLVKDSYDWSYYMRVCNDRLFRFPYVYVSDVFHDMTKDEKDFLDVYDHKYVNVCGIKFHEPVTSRQLVYSNEIVDVFPTKKDVQAAVWIQPRFFKADPNQPW